MKNKDIEQTISDIETILDFVERWNKQDEEKEVAESARKVRILIERLRSV